MHGKAKPVTGRPLGEVAQAIIRAARKHCTDDQCPTLSELAMHAGVGHGAAMQTVKNLTRSGHLSPVRSRKVAGRNRPAMEYAPRVEEPMAGAGSVVLAACLSRWMA